MTLFQMKKKILGQPIWPPGVTKNSAKAVIVFISIIFAQIWLKLHRNVKIEKRSAIFNTYAILRILIRLVELVTAL